MKIISNFFIIISTLLLLSYILIASEIVAKVNNSNITKEEINNFVESQLPTKSFNKLTPEQQQGIIDRLIDSKLFLEDAKKMNIENSLEFKKALTKVKEKLMLDFWMKRKVEEIKISDIEAKLYYRDNRENFFRPASVKVRHILLANEREAKEIIRELKFAKNLKEKFVQLAKEKSIGPSSVNGGELNWFVKEQMVPEFSESAFSLSKGTITTKPIKTQFGYHVIYLEDKKDEGEIPFTDVKSNIIEILRGIKFKDKLVRLSKKMRKKAVITVK